MKSENYIDAAEPGIESSEVTTLDLLLMRMQKIAKGQRDFFLLIIVLILVVCLSVIWALSVRIGHLEKELSDWRKETETKLALAIKGQQNQIDILSEAVIDKKFLEVWGSFIREVEESETKENTDSSSR